MKDNLSVLLRECAESSYIEYSDDVYTAIQHKQPILALESTLITHGLPYPHNIETALHLEALTRTHGTVPATIAIMQGKIKLGLTQSELETLVKDKHCFKASARDIPYLIAKKLNAGTTVAAALFCARLANIKVFATGGIGGVHRGDTQDISADLIELSRTPIAVICAGAKAILDLPKTIELLETLSIPVIGYKTKLFPAFYTRHTSYPLSSEVNTIEELKHLINIHWQIGLRAGIFIANPIPQEYEIESALLDPVIEKALMAADEKQIRGKDITPYLLSHIAKMTEGKSLSGNIKLIENNVSLGAMLAKALANQ